METLPKLPTRGAPAGILTLSGAMSFLKNPAIKQDLSSLKLQKSETETDDEYNIRLMVDVLFLVSSNLEVMLPALVKLDGSIKLEDLESRSTDESLVWIEEVLTENKPNFTAFTDFLGRVMKQESPTA